MESSSRGVPGTEGAGPLGAEGSKLSALVMPISAFEGLLMFGMFTGLSPEVAHGVPMKLPSFGYPAAVALALAVGAEVEDEG
eukprot:14602153-Alexandrium_andersonii.AAC.1